jgi:hypothetical protein
VYYLIYKRQGQLTQSLCLSYAKTEILEHSSITSIKSPSFCTTNFSASLTKLTALLPQSHDCSCYVSRPILAPPPFWLHKHIDLRTHGFAHSAHWWHQHRLFNVNCAWSWRLCGISPATWGYERFRIFSAYFLCCATSCLLAKLKTFRKNRCISSLSKYFD